MLDDTVQYSLCSQLWPGSSVHSGCQVCLLDFGAIGSFEPPLVYHNLVTHLEEMHSLSLSEAREDYRRAMRTMLDRRINNEGDFS